MGLTIAFVLASLGLLVWAFDDGEDPTENPGGPQEGSDGDDTLIGTAGVDDLFGNLGNDDLEGRGEDDRLFGGPDEDLLAGQDGDDFLRGGPDDDILIGGAGSDTLVGDGGNDLLIAADILDEEAFLTALRTDQAPADPSELLDIGLDNDAGDTIRAGRGDDLILLGSDDTVIGGAGADSFGTGDWVEPGRPAVVEDYDPDEDVIIYSFEGAEPAITTEIDEDGDATVLADGIAFLIVRDAGPEFSPVRIELEQR